MLAPMKQFWITLLAALAGTTLALMLYDAFIVRPRAAVATNAQVHRVDLAQARSEAAKITADVDASIDRSVARAREASEAQASEMEKRRLAMEPLARATMLRTAITEYYLTEGRWPANAADVGLPTDATRGSAGRISIGAGGTITIAYDDRFARGSRIRLSPDVTDGMQVQWLCRSEGDPDLSRFIPACKG